MCETYEAAFNEITNMTYDLGEEGSNGIQKRQTLSKSYINMTGENEKGANHERFKTVVQKGLHD